MVSIAKSLLLQATPSTENRALVTSLISLAIGVVCTIALTPYIFIFKQSYTDLIVGHSTFRDSFKTGDYILLATCLLTTGVVFFIVNLFANKLLSDTKTSNNNSSALRWDHIFLTLLAYLGSQIAFGGLTQINTISFFVFPTLWLALSYLLRSISPILVALIATVFAAYPSPWDSYWRDNFHLGELTLPWQQIMDHGNSGFVAVQGLLGLSYGAVNSYLFDGTVSSVDVSILTVKLSIAFITAYALARRIPQFYALLMLPTLTPASDRFLLIPLAVILLSSRKLWHTPAYWLASYLSIFIIGFTWNPSSAIAIAIGFFPAVMCAAINLKDSNIKQLLSAALVLLCLTYICGSLLIGSYNFIADNGSSNTIAYGLSIFIPQGTPNWFPNWFESPQLNRWFWEIHRIGLWLLCSTVLMATAFWSFRNPADKIKATTFFAMAVIPVILSPYLLGRIDPHNLSRTGYFMLVSVGMFFPFAWALTQGKHTARPIISYLLLGAFLGVANFHHNSSGIIGRLKLFQTHNIPSSAVFINGDALGMPRLGSGRTTQGRLDEFRKLSTAINKYIAENETYLDLTNSSAWHFYIDKTVPVPYAADFLVANSKITSKQLAALHANPPKLILAGPHLAFDGIPFALRSYGLYKWLMFSSYHIVEENGYTFFVHTPDKSGFTADELAKLKTIYFTEELSLLPEAWGRNYNKLSNNFLDAGEVNKVYSRPNKNTVVMEFADSIKGRDADFLLIDLEGTPTHTTNKLTVSWKTENQNQPSKFSDNQVVMNFNSNRLLLPIGTNPTWLHSQDIKHLMLKFHTPKGNQRGWFVKNIRLLRYS